MNIVKNIAALLLTVFLASPALIGAALIRPALAMQPDDAVQAMQKTYGAMQSFQAEFTQSLVHQESKTTQVRKGVLLFAKPLKIRWETASPNPELIVVTGKEIWNYLADEELAYRHSMKLVQDSRSMLSVLTGQSSIDKDFTFEQIAPTAEDRGAIHIVLYPKEPSPQLVEAALWIDPQTGLIQRADLLDFYGNTNSVVFEKITPDPKYQDADFTFAPPKGTEIEDKTAEEEARQ